MVSLRNSPKVISLAPNAERLHAAHAALLHTERETSKGATMIQSREFILERVTVDPATKCWNWKHTTNTGGYGVSHFKGKTIGSHRLSYIVFRGKIPKGMCVCHTFDNPPCCNPSHLWVGTLADNNRDRDEKGRTPTRFTNHSGTKLKGKKWKCFVARVKTGQSPTVIAKEFGVHTTTAYKLFRKLNNKKVKDFSVQWSKFIKHQGSVRSKIRVMFKGKLRCLREISDMAGVNYQTLYSRFVQKKWPINMALNAPKYHQSGRIKL